MNSGNAFGLKYTRVGARTTFLVAVRRYGFEMTVLGCL